jgi:hypothetical protein
VTRGEPYDNRRTTRIVFESSLLSPAWRRGCSINSRRSGVSAYATLVHGLRMNLLICSGVCTFCTCYNGFTIWLRRGSLRDHRQCRQYAHMRTCHASHLLTSQSMKKPEKLGSFTRHAPYGKEMGFLTTLPKDRWWKDPPTDVLTSCFGCLLLFGGRVTRHSETHCTPVNFVVIMILG